MEAYWHSLCFKYSKRIGMKGEEVRNGTWSEICEEKTF